MAAPVREATIVEIDPRKRIRHGLKRIMFGVLERHQLDAEICEADDGTPYLSIALDDWSSIMVTPDHVMGRFAIVLTDETGNVRIARGQHEGRALTHVLRHL